MQGVDTQNHQFELLKLSKENSCYLVQFAVDGRVVPAFYEPAQNCDGMNEAQFLEYLKSQSLAMKDYMETVQ